MAKMKFVKEFAQPYFWAKYFTQRKFAN